MAQKYGNNERAALIVLMRENREVPNRELANDHQIELRQPGRDKLNADGLIVTRKEKNQYLHKITAEGIAWCEQNLPSMEAPPRSGPLPRAMFELLRAMLSNLQQRGISLLDLISPTDLESLIRSAYGELSVKPQDWVRLAGLRAKLNGAEKDEVDQVLLAMSRTGLVHLAPDSDRRALTDADHTAAIRIGKEDKHLVAIEEA
ncbi:MAG TPA: hypothetical protein VHW44_02235 [Pseudonocardiaceae bacterium]|jgi:hypothetical protein|nr:hypothetical protein [Pseudonocardiaceae bacterium]